MKKKIMKLWYIETNPEHITETHYIFVGETKKAVIKRAECGLYGYADFEEICFPPRQKTFKYASELELIEQVITWVSPQEE